MKKLRSLIALSFLFNSHNHTHGNENLPQINSLKSQAHAEITAYFNIKDTQLADDFADSISVNFSSDSSKDQFMVFVPKGNINNTKSTIKITNQYGEIIYEHTFGTTELVVNDLAINDGMNDEKMADLIIEHAKNILEHAVIDPKNIIKDSFLDQAKKEDFEHYETFLEVKSSNRKIFNYAIEYKSPYFLAYSNRLKKVVLIITCCKKEVKK